MASAAIMGGLNAANPPPVAPPINYTPYLIGGALFIGMILYFQSKKPTQSSPPPPRQVTVTV